MTVDPKEVIVTLTVKLDIQYLLLDRPTVLDNEERPLPPLESSVTVDPKEVIVTQTVKLDIQYLLLDRPAVLDNEERPLPPSESSVTADPKEAIVTLTEIFNTYSWTAPLSYTMRKGHSHPWSPQ